MLPHPSTHALRGLAAGLVVYPLAERIEKRDIRSKERWLDRAMAQPYPERRMAAARALAEMVGWTGRNVPYYEDLFRHLRFDAEKLAEDQIAFSQNPVRPSCSVESLRAKFQG